MLPQDIFDLIAIFSGQGNVFHTLKHQLTPQVYDSLCEKHKDWDYAQIDASLKLYYFIDVAFFQISAIVYLGPRAEYRIKYWLKKQVELLGNE